MAEPAASGWSREEHEALLTLRCLGVDEDMAARLILNFADVPRFLGLIARGCSPELAERIAT
jgi:hypothetical protein